MRTKLNGTLSALALFALRPNAFMGGQRGGPLFDPTAEELATQKANEEAEKAKLEQSKEKVFKQADLDRALAEERRKQKSQNDELLKSKTLSDEQRASIEARNDELSKALLSKDEQLVADKKKLSEDFDKKTKEKDGEINHWKNLYQSETVDRQITDACVKHGAKNPAQIRSMLSHDVILQEKKDQALNVIKDPKTGKPKYEIVVPHIEKSGDKEVEKMVSIDAKIAAMATSEEHGNLFTSGRQGGTGHRPGSGGGSGAGRQNLSATQRIGKGLPKPAVS